MPRPQEIFWEVGKELWKNEWERGEFVKSPKFTVTDTCSLEIYFYPEGLGNYEKPLFKRVRSNTDEWMYIKGDIQLCHGITISKWYIFDDVYEKGKDCALDCLVDIPTLSKFRIFHSLPDLCYRLIFTVSTDEDTYAKRSAVLQTESSEPEANSVQRTESSDPEEELVQQTTRCSEPEAADSEQQTQSSEPEAAYSEQQTQSSEPEAAESKQQTQSVEPEANSV